MSIKEFLHIENEEKNKQIMFDNISEQISEINDNILGLYQTQEENSPVFSDLKDKFRTFL